MTALRPIIASALTAALVTIQVPASAQVGMPGYQPMPYGYAPPPQQPQGLPSTRYVSPVAMGLGIALAALGAGMLVGGFVALGIKGSDGQVNMPLSSALLSVGGTLAAISVPLIIYGAREVPAYAPYGYDPQAKLPSWVGRPRLVLGDPKAGAPVGALWAWQF